MRPTGGRGFALIVSITLMGFVILLLYSLSLLIRIESQSATVQTKQLQARQNALLALDVAIGKLQQFAGRDQVVTARADLVNAVANPYYVGIWDSTAAMLDPASPLVWLVSGRDSAGANVTPMTIIPSPDSSDNAAWVHKNSVDSNASVKVLTEPAGDGANGNYAYWIADESLKANAVLTDPWESPTDVTLAASEIEEAQATQFRYLSLPRSGIEGVEDPYGQDIGSAYPATEANFKAAIDQVASLSQLSLAPNSVAAQQRLDAAIELRFHDLTTYSNGLLVDVAQGGLKKDLTAWLANPGSGPSDDDFIASAGAYMPRWGAVRDYASREADGTAMDPMPAERVDINSPATEPGLHPVITYISFGLNVSNDGAGNPVQFHFFPYIILWNPYNVPISAHDYEMRFEFRGVKAALQNHTKKEMFARVHLAEPELLPGKDEVSNPQKRGMRFPLSCPQIEPGQSLVFTLDATSPYNENTNRLSAHAPARLDNSVTFEGPVMTENDLTYTDNSGVLRDIKYFTWFSQSRLIPSLRDAADASIVYNQIQSQSATAHSQLPLNFHSRQSNQVLEPLLAMTVAKYFSGSEYGPSGLEPRWLALHNPLATDIAFINPLRAMDSFFSTFQVQYVSFLPDFGTGNRASAGTGHSAVPAPVDFVALAFRPEDTPLLSLAQLQHANLALTNYNPIYAVGNSLASPYINRVATSATLDEIVTNGSTLYPPFNALREVHDLSYQLNEALWDRYFFSTIPDGISHVQLDNPAYYLPNPRIGVHDDDHLSGTQLEERLSDFDQAASLLKTSGAFNVNATSVEAWKALLHSRNGIAADDDDPDKTFTFPRYPDSNSEHEADSIWAGNRALTDAQIDHLAERIVDQVRIRGPFRSLADFVNRRLAADETGLKGTLQAAIDSVDSDIAIPLEERINVHPDLTDDDLYHLIDIAETNEKGNEVKAVPGHVILPHWFGSDEEVADIHDKPFASQAAFSPAHLTQADMLTTLGPVLTVRSDTFLIRAYGNVVNPLTQEREGEAWCEAVVQRVPEYINNALNAWESPNPNSENDRFGRKFKIVSFRWLDSSEL